METLILVVTNWWAYGVLVAFLVVGAALDCWQLRVPNWLTFGMMLSGLVLGAISSGWSGLWASLMLLGWGFLLLWPLYAIGGMGAGDVKLQMGFGAWVGALYGLREGFWIVFYGFCLAAIIGGILALGVMIWHRRWRDYRENVRQIANDFASAQSLSQGSGQRLQRKPRTLLLPYGLPLCLGFLCYLFLRTWMQS
ncbi:MAG: A24 family peptidase [Gemmatales bacterium]|nr:A24 family peptidase [Gemmatales bacterium]MDW8176383.1 A24 family peptidase [Gemmatales bacterium]